jgi:hypothetical protein
MKIIEMLERSSVTEPFREATVRFLREGRPNERVSFDRNCPPVKVERTLTRALEQYPELQIESIEVHGSSGCEYFSGLLHLHATTEVRRVSFHWDCKWRAEEQGWHDYFGFPDQIRAAREFGYDCFKEWEEEARIARGDTVPA